jgi:pimeloyl-ACP methyl ester carboxylesterase
MLLVAVRPRFVSEDLKQKYLSGYEKALSACRAQFASHQIETSFGNTHVLSIGSGSPVVAFHGRGVTSCSWGAMAPNLAKDHKVYLVDTIGEPGRSEAKRRISSDKAIADWIDQLFSHLGIKKASVMGLSNGGRISLAYALERPEKVERLALLAPVGGISKLSWGYLGKAMAAMVADTSKFEEFWQTHYATSNKTDLRDRIDEQFVQGMTTFIPGYDDILPMMKAHSARKLSSLPMPIMALFGEHEVIYEPHEAAEQARAVWPNAQVEVVKGAGHMMMFDQPDVVLDRVRSFFSGSKLSS